MYISPTKIYFSTYFSLRLLSSFSPTFTLSKTCPTIIYLRRVGPVNCVQLKKHMKKLLLTV